MDGAMERYDTIVVGGGQAGLSVGYHLKKRGVPFVILDVSVNGPYVILAFDSVSGVEYGIEERAALDGTPSIVQTVIGNGTRLQVALPLEPSARFFRLVAP